MSDDKYITWKNGLLGLTAAFIPVLTFLYVIFAFISNAKDDFISRKTYKAHKEEVKEMIVQEIEERKATDVEILKYINETIKIDMQAAIKTQLAPLKEDMYLIKQLQYRTLSEQKKVTKKVN